MKRSGTALLAMTLCLLVSSCGQAVQTPLETTSAASETSNDAQTTSEISDGLSDADYDGYEFRMLIRNDLGWIEDMYSESLDGDIMNDAVYNRNAKIADRFNVSFTLLKSSNDNYDTDGVKSIAAGDDAYDIILPHARASFVYAMQGLLIDWNTGLPNIDLDAQWWDQGARTNLSINHRLYQMTGDILYKCLGSTDAMLFNKKLFDGLSLDYPYASVTGGSWTFEKFRSIVTSSAADLNGDGVISYDDDRLGYITSEWIGPIEVLYSGDSRIVSKDKDDIPYLSLNTDKTVKIFSDYFALIDSDAAHCSKWEDMDTSVASGDYEHFANDQALFLDTNIKNMTFLRDMDANFGVVPWPKFDETVDEYYSNVDAGCSVITVPVTAKDVSRTSAILETLCCEGYKSVLPAYYNVVLATKYTRDGESSAMLDLIRAHRIYDLGYYNNQMDIFNSIGEYMFSSKQRDFASIYAKNESAASTVLQKLIKAYSE